MNLMNRNSNERLKNVRANVDSTSEAFFSMWDYIWLERPQGERNGVAIDHEGRFLTDQSEILELVKNSLKLPRATLVLTGGRIYIPTAQILTFVF